MKQKVALDPVKADAIHQLSGDDVEPQDDVEEEADNLLTGGVSLQDDDMIDRLGDAFGIPYDLAEELFCGVKEFEGDRHRWELDPASSEDYRDRCRAGGAAWRWRHFSH